MGKGLRKEFITNGMKVNMPLINSMSHKQLDDMIYQTAKLTGWLAYHTYRSAKSEPGYPDFTLVKDGITYWVEIKVGKDKLSDDSKSVD